MKNTLLFLFFLLQVFAVQASVNFDFDDTNETNLNLAVNDGTSTGSWDDGGPFVQDSALNIGYTPNYKFTNSHDLSSVFRNYSLDTPLTTGEYTFEVEIDSYDLTGTWGMDSSSSSDKGINFIIKGSDGIGATLNLLTHFLALGPNGQPLMATKVQSNDWGAGAEDATIETRYGASDPSAANYLSFDTDVSLVLQVNANLDTGAWTARFKEADSETWISLTQDGNGLDEITDIQLKISHRPNDPWGDVTLGDGQAGDFVRVGGISLSAPEVVAPASTADIAIQGNSWGGNVDQAVTGTFIESLIGDSDQVGTEAVTLQIAAKLGDANGNWSSRYKVGSGDWVSLVTDGTGLTDVNRLQINTKTPDGESWGSDTTEGVASDYMKIDSLKVVSATSGDAVNDFTVDYSNPLIAFEFDDTVGSEFSATNSVSNTGSLSGSFKVENTEGHKTDGAGYLNIGYTDSNKWVDGDFPQSYRTFNLASPITSDDASDLVVLEAVISNYDLSKTWDENFNGSYSGKGVQFSMQNSNNAGAAINFYTNNRALPDMALQLDFDDAQGTQVLVSESIGLSGSWDFEGPKTDGAGNLNIGFTEEAKWTNIYGTDGNARRTFLLDEAITTGRYIIETRIDSASLDNLWNDPVDLVAGKGLQIIAKKEDGSGAVVNLYSHVNNAGAYQVKTQSNSWAGENSTTESTGLKQAFGLPSNGNIDIQILVNATTGQWTTRAKSASSSTWKNMEQEGTGFMDIKSIQINAKTPNNTVGTGLAIWGTPDDPLTADVNETTPVGDYVKIDHIRILNDTTLDTNNDIVITGKKYGSNAGVSGSSVPVSLENFTQSGENLRLKIDANLDTGVFSSSYSTDSGINWVPLTTDGSGLNEIKYINFTAKTGIDDAWGTADIEGGQAGDYIKIESIKLTDTVANTDLVAFEFDDVNGVNISVANNSGTAAGSWSNGGPLTQGGALNIGYTNHYKWTNAGWGHLENVTRKFVLDSSVTSGQVELVIDIKDYDLSRAWDKDATYDVNSATGKGIQFGLVDSTETGGLVSLYTDSAVDFPDSDGDGIPDHVDPVPNSGTVFEGYYLRYDFNDENGTALNAALNLGVPSSNFLDGGPQTNNGNLNIGYPKHWKWTGVDTGANATVYKSNELSEEITSGVIVYEMVIDSYDLSKSWDPNSESDAEKGVRMIIKNGNGGGDPLEVPNEPRQGTAINLYTTGDGKVKVQAQPWYGGDSVVKSESGVSHILADGDMADDQDLTFQIVVNLETGAFYSRFSQDDGVNWENLIENGSGFNKISSIQIGTKRSSTDSWGDTSLTGGIAGDFVTIDSIHIRDANSETEPTPEMPADTDNDGYFDYEDDLPENPNEWIDEDDDGVGAISDPDDNDPNNPNPQTPATAPVLSITSDGTDVTVTWEGGEGFNLQSSGDLTTWTNTSATTSPHTESIEGTKFFKLTSE